MSPEEVLVANAVTVWKGALDKADKLFNGLSDDELEKRIAPDRNRLIYIWGHLTAMHDRVIVLLGLGERLKPDFDAIFLSSPDGASKISSVEDIRQAWRQVSNRLNVGIDGLSPSDWLSRHTAVSEEDFAKDPLRNKISILLTRTNHLSYHLGQSTLVRR